MTDFASLIIIGAVASLFTQLVKQYFVSSQARMGVAIITAVLLGTGYHFLQGTELLATIITVLMSAGAVYTFLLKQILE
jgi:uncharacterized membrane protein YesL